MYNIEAINRFDKSNCSYINTDCKIYCAHVQITNINKMAAEIKKTIEDTCWIKELLDEDDIDSYLKRAESTIKYIVNEILNKVNNDVSSDFGEYLISSTSQMVLKDSLNHDKILLAEVWKEQVSGNPGFDFHSFSPNDLLVYGEAKYNAKNSPYNVALTQINHFISIDKDIQEYTDLKRIFSKISTRHKSNSHKAFAAAFLLNAKNTNKLFENVLKTKEIKKLMDYPELYAIGVEICH